MIQVNDCFLRVFQRSLLKLFLFWEFKILTKILLYGLVLFKKMTGILILSGIINDR